MERYINLISLVRSASYLNHATVLMNFWMGCIGTPIITVNSHRLAHELSDEKRFKKIVAYTLSQVK